jgi:hypothetical protein
LYCSAVRRRSWLFRAFVAVVVAGAVVYLPAELAARSTAPDEPVSFLSNPAEGWRFVWTVARARPGAVAGTPAAAKRLALRAFDDGVLMPARVDLLWLPDERVSLQTLQGSAPVATKSRLVWKVTGRRGAHGRLATIGLIDFSTGRVIWDARLVRR